MNKNSKLLSQKIPDKVFPILEDYTNDKQNGDFIFPEMKKTDLTNAKDVYARTITANKKFITYLVTVAEKAGISKKATMHIARHTFGNISKDKIPINMLQKLYRHSSITTTINYRSNFMHRDAGDALDSVLNF